MDPPNGSSAAAAAAASIILPAGWNNSQQALVYSNNASLLEEAAVTHLVRLVAVEQPASPTIIVVAILLVFLFSPTIIIGNALVLISIYRFKRLRTPSNYLVMSLATSDLGVGIYMPVGMYLELCGGGEPETSSSTVAVCLLNYSAPITLCCVSVLVMVAIAVDRFTSLARPLRYNNLITHTAMERYIAVFWVYAALVGIAPFSYHMVYGTPSYQSSHCSFGNLVPRPVQLFMFCAVYGPSAFVLLVCYGYIYVVARGHARAISEVRHSLQYGHGASQPRYGLALAITTGMFLTLWLPFQICMLLDVFTDTKILTHWIAIYLALPIVSSSAFNPWIYGYRNAELRLAVQKVVDDMLTVLGFNYRSHPIGDAHVVAPSVAATAGDAGSLLNHHNHTANHHNHNETLQLQANDDDYDDDTRPHPALPIKREYYSWNPEDEYLLVPMAKPESSGFLSLDEDKWNSSAKNVCNNNNNSDRVLNGGAVMMMRNDITDISAAKRSKKKKCQRRNLGVHLSFNFIKESKDKDGKDKEKVVNGVNGKDKDVKISNGGELQRMELEKVNNKCKENHCGLRSGLKGSKSMIETFAGLRNGTDVWIFKGKNLMINGASIV